MSIIPIITTTAVPKTDDANVVQLTVIDSKLSKKEKVRYNKDGSIDKRHSNRIAGESSEVYAFTTKEEIEAMISVFNKHIEEAENNNQRQIACRNKMLFLVGINLGIRASDIRSLKYSFFLNDDNTFKEFYTLQPKKQKKQKKFVKLYFNQTIKKTITDYLSEYPVADLDTYLFPSRKGNEPISVGSLWRIIKETAKEAGITNKNIGSHTLRKTWGFWCFHEATDKNKALVILQKCFNHSSSQVTLKYIGILNEEIADMYYSIELGYDCLDN